MIKEEKVLIKINIRNITYYRNLNYDINGKELLVDIKDLNPSSKVRVTATCELCGNEKELLYCKYIMNKNRNGKGFYSCFKCKNIEKEKTCIKKYGVKSYSMTDEFRTTESEKWKGIQKGAEKSKKTLMERYGVDSYFKTDIMRERNREWMSSDEFKEKSRVVMLEKYGVESYAKTDEFKKRISDNKTTIVEKIRKTFMEKYGKDWISQVDEIKEKVKRTLEKNGNRMTDEELSRWKVFRREVRNITSRNKKKLFENWDGYDYYDGEFIKGNFSYCSKNRMYPSIDHKISLFYGFENNMNPEEIGTIDNLCITKRYINSIKGKLIEEMFNL